MKFLKFEMGRKEDHKEAKRARFLLELQARFCFLNVLFQAFILTSKIRNNGLDIQVKTKKTGKDRKGTIAGSEKDQWFMARLPSS